MHEAADRVSENIANQCVGEVMTDKYENSEKNDYFIRFLIVGVFIFACCWTFSHTIKVIDFWQHGTEEHAYIDKLVRTQEMGSKYMRYDINYTIYTYQFSIDGKTKRYEFMQELHNVGKVVMLTNSNYPETAILGGRKTSFIELYIRSVGGEWNLLLVLILQLFLIFIAPKYIYLIIMNKKFVKAKEE